MYTILLVLLAVVVIELLITRRRLNAARAAEYWRPPVVRGAPGVNSGTAGRVPRPLRRK